MKHYSCNPILLLIKKKSNSYFKLILVYINFRVYLLYVNFKAKKIKYFLLEVSMVIAFGIFTINSNFSIKNCWSHVFNIEFHCMY